MLNPVADGRSGGGAKRGQGPYWECLSTTQSGQAVLCSYVPYPIVRGVAVRVTTLTGVPRLLVVVPCLIVAPLSL